MVTCTVKYHGLNTNHWTTKQLWAIQIPELSVIQIPAVSFSCKTVNLQELACILIWWVFHNEAFASSCKCKIHTGICPLTAFTLSIAKQILVMDNSRKGLYSCMRASLKTSLVTSLSELKHQMLLIIIGQFLCQTYNRYVVLYLRSPWLSHRALQIRSLLVRSLKIG